MKLLEDRSHYILNKLFVDEEGVDNELVSQYQNE